MKYKQFLIVGVALMAASAFAHKTGPAPQRIQRTEAIAMGNLIEVVPPQYPAEAHTITGKVVVKIVISTEGRVTEAKVLSGHPMLMSATLEAVTQWKFRPYIVDNVPVEVETTATVEFTADPPYVVTPKPFQGPRMIRVSHDVMAANLLHKVDPRYPRDARAKHIQGDVILLATIDKQGNISGLKVVSGNPLLADAATEAVKQWKYAPFLLNGEPVEVETVLKIQFHM